MRRYLPGAIAALLLMAPRASFPQAYVVKAGDTLSTIAEAHGLTYQALGYHNRMYGSVDFIDVGQVIDIPERAVRPPPSEEWFVTSNWSTHRKAFLEARYASEISAIALGRELPSWITPDTYSELKDCSAKIILGAKTGRMTLVADETSGSFLVKEPETGRSFTAYPVSDGEGGSGMVVDVGDHVAALPTVPDAWEPVFQAGVGQMAAAPAGLPAPMFCLH